MPFTIPNEADAFHVDQAEPDKGDLETLAAGSQATGVVSGCAVTAQGSPDMTCAVAAGVVAVAGAKVNVAAGNVTITTAHGTNPRIDLVVVSSAGAKSVTAGTAAAQPVFPAIPANSVVLAAVYVPANDTTIASNQITDKRVFVVPPTPTMNYDLAQARKMPRVTERSQTVTLDTGQNLVHASALANGRLFLSGQTSPAWFVRCNNLEDLTDRTSFNFASDGFHDNGQAMTYVAETDKVYVLFGHASRVCVSSVDANNTVVDVINDTTRVAGSNGSICSDGTHLYVATLTSPAKVIKYTLAGAFVAEVTLTNNNAHAILYDGTELFVTGTTSPGWIARVTTALVEAAVQTLPTGANIVTDDMASVGEYIWIGVEVSNNISIFRIEKANLANQLRVYSPTTVWLVHYDGRHVWAGRGDLSRIDPETLDFTIVSMPADTNEMMSDGTGRVFVATYESPTKVARIYSPLSTQRRFALSPSLPVGGSIDTVFPMGKRFIDSATRATSGSSEATLGQMSVSGNLLNVDGMVLRITVSGTFAANANNKRVAIRWNATNYMFDTGLLPFNDARWKFVCEAVRTGAATQDWNAYFVSDSSVLPTEVQLGTTAADLSTLLFLAVRGQGTAASDVVQEYMMVEVIS